MAKKKHTHHHKDSREEEPATPVLREDHAQADPRPMDQDASDKLLKLKALNSILLKETQERRHQVESLEQVKEALENELARFGGKIRGLETELAQADREAVGLAIEKAVIRSFLETQMGQIRVEAERLANQGDAEVLGLRKSVSELVENLENERVFLREVSGERDSLKSKCVALAKEADGLKESLSEVGKVRTNLEVSLKKLKMENEKLIREKEDGEEVVKDAVKGRDSAERKLLRAAKDVDELKAKVEELASFIKNMEIEKNGQQKKIDELQKEVAVLNEIEASLRKEEVQLREQVLQLENRCDAAVEKEKEMVREIEVLSKEKNEKEANIETLKGKYDSLEELLKNAENELNEKEQLVEAIVSKKLEIEEANYCKQNEIAGLKREVSELKSEMTGLEIHCRDLAKENESLQSELCSCREARNQVMHERDGVREDLEEEKQNIMKLMSEVSELTKRIDDSVDELRLIRTERDQLIVEKEDIQSKLELFAHEKGLVEKKFLDAQQSVEDLKAKIDFVGAKSQRTLTILRKTAALVNQFKDERNGKEVVIGEQEFEMQFQPYMTELEAIKNAFRIKESMVEDLKQKIQSLQDSAAKAQKQKGFWTLLSSATTLLAAISVAYLARGR